mgnify:CR=1 FL=1
MKIWSISSSGKIVEIGMLGEKANGSSLVGVDI